MSKQLDMFDNEYERKRKARIERLKAAAERKRQEAESRFEQSDRMASVIPMGQPILVGHHSEQADRRYRERIHDHMRKGWELRADAQDLERRAEAAEKNTAISSDDPNAATKLQAKIEQAERKQETWKKINKFVRKDDRAGLAEMGLSESTIAELFTPDFAGRIGIPDYQLKNNGANLRRMKQRLAKLECLAERESVGYTISALRVEEDADANRLRLYFPGKPPSSIRQLLKSRGFRWARSVGAWQRMISNAARYEADYIAGKYDEAVGAS